MSWYGRSACGASEQAWQVAACPGSVGPVAVRLGRFGKVGLGPASQRKAGQAWIVKALLVATGQGVAGRGGYGWAGKPWLGAAGPEVVGPGAAVTAWCSGVRNGWAGLEWHAKGWHRQGDARQARRDVAAGVAREATATVGGDTLAGGSPRNLPA